MVNYDFLYNKEYYGAELQKNHFYDKKLHFRIIENATVLPFINAPGASGFGGIVDSKFNFIEGTDLHAGHGGAYTPDGEVKYINTPVIYMGMFFHCWGHCITDNIKRVWFLKTETYKKNFKNYPIIWSPMTKWGGAVFK